MRHDLPSVTFIIPTLNAALHLKECLETIHDQDYPRSQLQILIIDGGSTDGTRQIAGLYDAVEVLENRLRTAEAGKAVGISQAKGSLVAFVDSDNRLDGRDWLKRMVAPLEDPEIVSSEVLYWSYRPEDSAVDRYCALTGINDPVNLFLGNYDRYSTLTERWTDYPHTEIDRGNYLEVRLDPDRVPTMGANGYLARKEILAQIEHGPYYFDIDAVQQLAQRGFTKIARVKVGIVHHYASGLRSFALKQRRRIRDYRYYSSLGLRSYDYPLRSRGLVKFVLYTVLTIPTLLQAWRGYRKLADPAWFLHPLACWITLWEYAWGVVWGTVRRRPFDRQRLTR